MDREALVEAGVSGGQGPGAAAAVLGTTPSPTSVLWRVYSWVWPPHPWDKGICYGVVVSVVCLCARWLFLPKKKESQETRRVQKWENRRWWLPSYLRSWIETDVPIRFRVTGQTGDCEYRILKEVSDNVSLHLIHLKKDDSSPHFLLLFCPVVSRVGTDMLEALEGLGSEKRVILVMLHHIPKESNRFVDTKLQARHPAVVRTVHAHYTLEEGFYACQVNQEAVATVAQILKDHCEGMREKPQALVLWLYLTFWSGVAILIVIKSGIARRLAGHAE